ncbi:ultraviolet-B receptor UVR8-like [Rhodamnia argentea]|uniref:Ultraviolet-B receptor UVR8-like n=1 Tax=Rhodamnia argentea TaxID=178133 RepID=A0ABM3HGG6_9MYRT|nr:ultraviolet-B receptor UVR8-like [Rhodamnia argentea]
MSAREILGLSSAKEVAEKRVLEGMDKEKDTPILLEPCLVEELRGVEEKVCPISIPSGLGYSIAICKDASLDAASESSKKIVSWGWNESCKLGRPGPENLPLVVDGLAGECPVSVSEGRVHSIALTSKRQAWVWGCGRNGRLGLGSSKDETEPTFLRHFRRSGSSTGCVRS